MLREYICMTHPLNIPYMVENGHLKVKDGHLTLLAWLPNSPQSGLRFWMEKHQTYVSLFGKLYIPNLFKNEMKKNICKQRETVSSLGTGKQFYIFVKVGYYPLLSLAVLPFFLFIVYCCLLSFIILFIGYTIAQSYGL